MKRVYGDIVKSHFAENRQMLFLAGPRQVGKTTIAMDYGKTQKVCHYFNWDNQDDQLLILSGPKAVADFSNLQMLSNDVPLIIFDEIHKYPKWKNFLKGFYDTYHERTKILVTGSARLDVYRSGGDSLMGRYFPYRVHPLSVAECLRWQAGKTEINPPMKISERKFQTLLSCGGFPEPFNKGNRPFYRRWSRLKQRMIFNEDIRDASRIHAIKQLEILAELLKHQAGQLVSYSSLAVKVRVSVDTIRSWISTLSAFYYCFTISPWSQNISRSLIKQPKVYLWDWSEIKDKGARAENFIAAHLLKAVHFWTDCGLGDYGLFFIRDKEQREVDFLVTKDGSPWFLVEVKFSDSGHISNHLELFQKKIGAKHAFQVNLEMDYVDKSCFLHRAPLIVPAKTFLSQLV